jgi:O-antigen/teichoic acid export membrane protein
MHGGEMLIPILVPLGLFAMIFGIVYMNKKENLAMIEKGINPKLYSPAPYKNLKWGLLLVGAGLGLFVAYLIDRLMLRNSGNFGHHDDEAAIYFALIGIGGGLGLIASYRIEKKEVLDKNNNN